MTGPRCSSCGWEEPAVAWTDGPAARATWRCPECGRPVPGRHFAAPANLALVNESLRDVMRAGAFLLLGIFFAGLAVVAGFGVVAEPACDDCDGGSASFAMGVWILAVCCLGVAWCVTGFLFLVALRGPSGLASTRAAWWVPALGTAFGVGLLAIPVVAALEASIAPVDVREVVLTVVLGCGVLALQAKRAVVLAKAGPTESMRAVSPPE